MDLALFSDTQIKRILRYELSTILHSPVIHHRFALRTQNPATKVVCTIHQLTQLIWFATARRSTACLKLEEYQTARTASLAPTDSRFTKLIKECEKCIAEEKSVVPEQASQIVPEKDTQAVSVADPVATASPAKPKYRHEYYQKSEEIVVTIFAKGIRASSVVVDFGEQILSAKIDVPGEDAFHFQTRLFGKIVPDKCKYLVLSTKIEIRLAKLEAIQWPSLEFSKESSAPRTLNNVSSVCIKVRARCIRETFRQAVMRDKV